MHFASICAAFLAALSFVTTSVATALPVIDTPSILPRSLTTAAPGLSSLEARATNKRPKYTRKPLSQGKCPIKRPKGCTNIELLKNSDLDKNINGWSLDNGGGASQIFWVKNSKQRPSHSGNGQMYIFLARGFATVLDMSTALPAVEYGNSITISMWMRYEAHADLSSCYADWSIRGFNGNLPVTLNPTWTKYTWEVPGFGRPERLRFVIVCQELRTPVSIFLDDINAKACVPKNPDSECQVLKSSDNLLVNPGFECPDGIAAWQSRSNSGGNDSLVQFGSTRNNPTHSGKGQVDILASLSLTSANKVQNGRLRVRSVAAPRPHWLIDISMGH